MRVGDSACATGIVWNEEGTEWMASEKRGKCCAAAWWMLQRAPDRSRAGWGDDERVVILEYAANTADVVRNEDACSVA
jgi:hypothetical protein